MKRRAVVYQNGPCAGHTRWLDPVTGNLYLGPTDPKVALRSMVRVKGRPGVWVDSNGDWLVMEVNATPKVPSAKSDGSSADYYKLPEGATELQHLISHRNMNAQMGEIFRSAYRYGRASHSDKLRDARKIKFYIEAEIERLEKLAVEDPYYLP